MYEYSNTCCGICGENHEAETCAAFVTHKVINDTFTLSKARLTLPQGLSVADRVDGSTAVIAKSKFGIGVRFGPFIAKTSTTLDPKINFPLKLFDVDATWDDCGSITYTDLFLESGDEDCCNWMCLVSAANTSDEQNLFCFQMKKELYFLAIKDININDELKVWYAPYYAKRMCSTALVRLSIAELPQTADTCSPSEIADFNIDQDIPCNSYTTASTVAVDESCGGDHRNSIRDHAFHSDQDSNLWNVHNDDSKFNSNNKSINISSKRNSRGEIRNKRRPTAASVNKLPKITPKTNVLQPSHVMCFDYASKSDCSSIIDKKNNQTVCLDSNSNNNNNNSSLVLNGAAHLLTLLLGAKQLKSKWQCTVCDNIEYNVASHAKHLMLHCKRGDNDKINGNLCLKSPVSKTCACGTVLKSRKKLEEHNRVCSKVQTDDNLLRINNNSDVVTKTSDAPSNNGDQSNIISISNENFNEITHPTSMVSDSDGINFTNMNSNNCESDSRSILVLEMFKDICTNNKTSMEEKQQSEMITDVNVNMDNDFLLTNDFCGDKENDFQCFNFPDPLRSLDESKHDKDGMTISDKDHNDVDNSLNLCQSVSAVNNDSVRMLNTVIDKQVEETDCLLNTVPKMPPILDLTDDEIIVFQSIKNFTKVNNNSNCSVDTNNVNDNNKIDETLFNEKDLISSTNYDKQSCNANVASVNITSCGNNYNIDYQTMSALISDTFSTNVKTLNYNNVGNDKNVTVSNDLLIDRNDSFNNLLDNKSNDIIDSGNYDLNNDVVMNVDVINGTSKDQVFKNTSVLNMNLNENVISGSAAVQFQHQQISSETILSLTKNNVFSEKEICSSLGDKENKEKANGAKEYVCDICGKRFQKSLYLCRHLRKHTGEFSCTFCMAVFARKENLNNHTCSSGKNVLKLLKKNGRLCNLCGQIFNSKTEFRNHQSKSCHLSIAVTTPGAGKADKLNCIYCGKNYSNLNELKLHMEFDHASFYELTESSPKSQRSFLCDVCGVIRKNKRSLNQHLVTHGEPRFCCTMCSKKYHRNDLLQNHLALHQPTLPVHQCLVCDKKFKTKNSLCAHIKMHTGIQRFRCDQCDKGFFQKGNLLKHLRTHSRNTDSAQTQFKCKICERLFQEESRLKSHVKKVHDDTGNFTCSFCNATMKYRSTLQRHINKRHPTEKNVAIPLPHSSCLVNNNSTAVINDTAIGCNSDKQVQVARLRNHLDGKAQMIQEDEQSLNTIVPQTATTATINGTGSSHSTTVYILETGKMVPSDLPKTMLSTEDSGTNVTTTEFMTDNISNCTNGDDIADNSRSDEATDYLYYILTPSSSDVNL